MYDFCIFCKCITSFVLVSFVLFVFCDMKKIETGDLHLCFTLLQDDICFRTNGTIVNVDTCPKNLYDLLRRSQRKKCDSFQPCRNESLVYHCVRFEDSIIEVCAPKGTITGMVVLIFRSIKIW